MARRKRTREDELLYPTFTDGFQDPGKRVSSGKRRHVYTSGTLYEKETGQYRSPGMDGTPLRYSLSHGKKTAPGTVTATKGSKVKGAQRGVGQETLDGLMLPKETVKTAMKNRKKPPRRR